MLHFLDEQEDFPEESFDIDWIPGESPFKSIENNNVHEAGQFILYTFIFFLFFLLNSLPKSIFFIYSP